MDLIVLILIISISAVSAQDEYFPGSCPFETISTKQNFNAQEYQGIWYTIQQYRNPNAVGCLKEEYEWKQTNVINGYKLGMFYVHAHERNLEQSKSKLDLFELPETLKLYGKGQYYYAHNGWPYWVIDTDYKTYSVVWSCWDEDTIHLNQHQERLTILARDWRFDVSSSSSLQSILNRFERSKLKTVVQFDEKCGHGGTENNNNNGNGNNDDGNKNDEDGGAGLTLPSLIFLILTGFVLAIT